MTPNPNGAPRDERPLCSRRTAVLSACAALLLVAVALLNGRTAPADAGQEDPAVVTPVRPSADRPADARPNDPRRKDAERRPDPPRPAPPPTDRAKPTIGLRVVDLAGKPRAGIPIEIVLESLGGGQAGLVEPAQASDANGMVQFPKKRAPEGGVAFFSVGMVLEEPLFVPIHDDDVTMTLTIPDSGALEVRIEDEAGVPFSGKATVMVLVAANDPWIRAATLERASTPYADGEANVGNVECGSLLLVEARTSEPSLAISPKLIEGPSIEGATVKTRLVVRPRTPSTESAASRPAPRSHAPGAGPAPGAPMVEAGERMARFELLPRDALPQWPLVLELRLERGPGGRRAPAGRMDARGAVTLAAPRGRYEASCRLWRARPDGWLVSDQNLVAPGQRSLEIASGQAPIGIQLDPAALLATASELMSL